MLVRIKDRQTAFDLWRAGLVVNKYGDLWGDYNYYVDSTTGQHRFPTAASIRDYTADAYIIVEE